MMKSGLINAILAYVMWGLLPLYWKLFESVPAGEILSHRIVWSFVFVAALVAYRKRLGEIGKLLANKAALTRLTICSLLITANWLIFIWAVNNGHVIETSLGYYLTPLLNVLLGVLFLREKPNRGQWLAVALAGTGVLLVAVDYGSFPWISITLAGSFGLYGLAKKKVKQEASIGLLTETTIVLPLALLYGGYLAAKHADTVWALPVSSVILLLLSGVATALPLLFFAKAASRLPLSTLGFVQYIAPTISLILSLLVFNETISPVLLISFSFIWIALVVYAVASINGARATRAANAN